MAHVYGLDAAGEALLAGPVAAAKAVAAKFAAEVDAFLKEKLPEMDAQVQALCAAKRKEVDAEWELRPGGTPAVARCPPEPAPAADRPARGGRERTVRAALALHRIRPRAADHRRGTRRQRRELSIADLGTGSGCIAIERFSGGRGICW